MTERLTSPRAMEINNSAYSRRTDTVGNVADGEMDQKMMVGLLPSSANTVIETKNQEASFSSPLLQRSVILNQSANRSLLGGNSFAGGLLIADKRKFTNRQDLEFYYFKKEGKSKLDSFLVPDLEEIKRVLNEKNIQH